MIIAETDLRQSAGSLKFCVTAIAPTLGYTNVGLSAVEYVHPPVDGIQEVELFFTAPTGPAPTAVELFELEGSINQHKWLQGVRLSYPGDTITLRNCTKGESAIGDSAFSMGRPGLRGDKLIVPVSYSGGCQPHTFRLNWTGEIKKSIPPQLTFELTHNNNKDVCEALLREQLQFDLSTLDSFPAEEVDLVVQGGGVIRKLRFTMP